MAAQAVFAQALDAPTLPAESAAPDASGRITEIRVHGTRRVEAEAVRRALTQRVGTRFDATRTADDLRAVWALKYFSDVQLLVQRLTGGNVAYVVRVTERPAIREVKLEGNKELSRDDFKEAIDLKPGTIFDAEAAAKNAKKIQEKYVEKGFFLAEVKWRTAAAGESQTLVDVVFDVREFAKVAVKEIQILGARQVDAAEIKSVMMTKEGSFLSFLTGEGTFREEMFQRDLAMIQAAYYDRGFINVKVDKPVITMSPDKRQIFISLYVEEGERYRIGALDFEGDLLLAKPVLDAKMTTRPGEWFNRSKLAADIAALTDIYYDDGYAYANITPQTRLAEGQNSVDIVFDIQKGKQVTVERIEITGNTKTRDKVIRRELRVYEGELFNGTQLRRSRDRVNALGFFETVEVTQRPGRDDAHMVVAVDVKEKPTGTFQVGFGLSTVEQFIFTAQVSQNNLLGWGQTASLSAQISGLRQLIQLSIFDPHFLDTNFILALNVFRTQANRFDFIRDSLGGDLTLGYHFFEDVMANLTYTREYVNVEPGGNVLGQVLLADRFRNGVTSSLRLALTWDRRDNRLFPTAGHYQYGSIEVAPGFLGSTFEFARYTLNSRFYAPLFWGLVLKGNLNVGFIQQLNPARPLPISEQYLVGGINSLRGYTLASVSPTILVGATPRPDASVTPFVTGGNKQLVLNLELEFPILASVGIRGVVFYDVGNAFAPNARFFEDFQYQLPLGMFHSIGFGFRWFSPVGPLRFEWGIPLTPRPQDNPVLFEFTIGNFF
ncbi:MAG: outer membrane protein assembly factor BamA [Myxococcaceae bacterium]